MLYKLLGLMSIILLVGCHDVTENLQPTSQSAFLLGTVVTVNIYDQADEALFTTIFDRLKVIEDKMSKTIPTSEISRINTLSKLSDGDVTVEVDPEVFTVIEKALEYGEKSEGRFNITLAPIVDLWGIGTEGENIPSKENIHELLKTVGLEHIKITGDNTLMLSKGTQIDLGGIAKGYAADEISRILLESGINKAIINLGGNVKVVGQKAQDLAFKVGIQNPLGDRNNYIGIVDAVDKTIVTSGDYERYFENEGIRYHHIFDPTTGYPYQTEVASVTIVCESSIVADAMSTILYLMDVESGIKFVDTLKGVDCIYVTKDKEVYVSNGSIREQFELVSEEFKLMND